MPANRLGTPRDEYGQEKAEFNFVGGPDYAKVSKMTGFLQFQQNAGSHESCSIHDIYIYVSFYLKRQSRRAIFARKTGDLLPGHNHSGRDAGHVGRGIFGEWGGQRHPVPQ
jgi:hypothetical protein